MPLLDFFFHLNEPNEFYVILSVCGATKKCNRSEIVFCAVSQTVRSDVVNGYVGVHVFLCILVLEILLRSIWLLLALVQPFTLTHSLTHSLFLSFSPISIKVGFYPSFHGSR